MSKKVKVIVKTDNCCNGMKGILTDSETMAFVDFGENKCPCGHIGIFLEYPFNEHYLIEEQESGNKRSKYG